MRTPLRFSIFKGGLFKLRLYALLGNPHTPSSLDTDKALEPTIYIFLHVHGAPSPTPPAAATALGEGLQDWVLSACRRSEGCSI